MGRDNILYKDRNFEVGFLERSPDEHYMNVRGRYSIIMQRGVLEEISTGSLDHGMRVLTTITAGEITFQLSEEKDLSRGDYLAAIKTAYIEESERREQAIRDLRAEGVLP